MKNWILALITAAVIGVSLAGCATNVATTKSTNFNKKPIEIVKERPFDILGPITLEKDWYGILGITTPTISSPLGVIPPNDLYFYQNGGVTYVDLLAEAKETYPDADAVVDINIDYAETRYFVFYAKRKNIVAGIAIKYVKAASEVPTVIPSINWSFSAK
jgi:hypothetical protein